MRRIIIPFILSALSGQPAAAFDIDWVAIGNPGAGEVNYEYRIARNETTIRQYAEFLTAVAGSDPYSLYNQSMSTAHVAGISRAGVPGSYVYSVIGDSGEKPITFVSWFDAARFCNWVHNGQGAGSTEVGVYTLNGAVSGTAFDFPVNEGAQVWIPSGSEWHKAAAYDPTKGDSGGYWAYATRRDSIDSNTIGVAGAANMFLGQGQIIIPSHALTNVGAYGPSSASFYGTNDQTGNVWEWIDDMILPLTWRGNRGGGWRSSPDSQGGFATMNQHTSESDDLGFRIASGKDISIVVVEAADGEILENNTETAYFSSVRNTASWMVKNKGYKKLTGIHAELAGLDRSDFLVDSAIPASLDPNRSFEVRIRYTSLSAGRKSAVFTMRSDASEKPDMTIALEGSDPSATEAWRFKYFGSPENEGSGADSADPDGDRIVNLMEFATGSDPKQPSGDPGDIVRNGSVLEYRYWRSKSAASELTFVREFASSPNGPWQQTGGTAETIISDDGVRQRVLVTTPASSAIERRFVRLRVTRR